MLRDLQFSYVTFTILGMTAMIISILVMPVWGKFADKYGNLTVIKLCLPFIAITPLLWALSPLVRSFAPGMLVPYLLLVEAFSGISWGGFNLVILNFVYDSVTRERTALCIAYLNVLSGFGVLVGATLGGWISSLPGPVLFMPPIIAVMVISGVVRLLIFLVLQPFVHEVREVRKLTLDEMKEKLIRLTPQKMIRLLDLRL
jgi:MFS family permease